MVICRGVFGFFWGFAEIQIGSGLDADSGIDVGNLRWRIQAVHMQRLTRVR
jgi:hypothetical protein